MLNKRWISRNIAEAGKLPILARRRSIKNSVSDIADKAVGVVFKHFIGHNNSFHGFMDHDVFEVIFKHYWDNHSILTMVFLTILKTKPEELGDEKFKEDKNELVP